MASEQKRVMLWAVPRSLSTVVCRVMFNSGYKTKIIFEPFVECYYFGPERVSTRYISQDPDHSKSYHNIKHMLEMKHEDFEFIFVKDTPFTLSGRMQLDTLPEGYTHTFLIRHPRDSITSLYTLINSGMIEGWEGFDPAESGFKEMVEMVHLFQQHGIKVIILDADDLMDNPEVMLQAYCKETGLSFVESMINWKPMSQTEAVVIFGDWPKEWFRTLISSSSFIRKPKTSCQVDDCTSHPEDLKQAIDEALPYYEELWALRLKP